MQEEVNEKTISLCIKGGKITAQILKAALIKLLAEMDKKKQRGKGEKSQCKKTGRQSIKSLQKSGAQITNIVVTDNNIKSFDRVARKWNVDYAFYQTEPGKYLLFFKSGQADAMTACFSEYSRKVLDIVVLHEIRKISNIPVIMLTALDDEYTQSNSFDEMADDYITKPFSMLILGKRITALLRRSQNKPAVNTVKLGDITVDFSGYTASDENGKIDITPKELEILKVLIDNILTKQFICVEVTI